MHLVMCKDIIYVADKKMTHQYRPKGFTLVEMLLVLAIMSTILVAILGYTTQKSDEMRRDRTAMQMEQILNAGLSYYLSFGSWPTQLDDLQTKSFLPKGTILSAWGQHFTIGDNGSTPGSGTLFSVCTIIQGKQAFSASTIIAGRLPLASATKGGAPSAPCPNTAASACTSSDQSCTISSSVNVPGQNLNNARSINFAGIYHNGACVPAPACPNATMLPTIMAVPVSVSGINDSSSPTTIYPLSSFTAYVIGTSASDDTPTSSPGDCVNGVSTSCYFDKDNGVKLSSSGKYWRVCIRIITEKGIITYDDNNKDAGIILALTRCVPQTEYTTPSVHGSQFTVFSP